MLGGGVIEAMGNGFLEGIRRVSEKHVLPSTMNGVQIVGTKLGDNAGVIGRRSFSASDVGRRQIVLIAWRLENRRGLMRRMMGFAILSQMWYIILVMPSVDKFWHGIVSAWDKNGIMQ